MTFAAEITVRFGDVDPAGIVYYPVVMHYCHVAFEEYFAGHVGIAYPDLIAQRHIGFPTVALETAFERPFEYGMVVRAEVGVIAVGRTSTRWRYRFLDREHGRLLARSINTTVAVDMRTFEKVELPDDLRRIFEDDAARSDDGSRAD